MDMKAIKYQEIDDESIYMPIAEINNIMSMPFAEINGEILDTKKLQEYIKENGEANYVL
jgi:ABC-type lipoprotein release transport system permease subunit